MPEAFCQGVFRSAQPCTLSRARRGGAISIRGPCQRCGERRCRTHCRCGRTGSATGWAAGRPAPKVAAARPAPAATVATSSPAALAETQVVAPRGRPAALGLEVLTTTAWWAVLLQAVSGASEVLAASFLFDHSGLTDTLLRRLRGRVPFSVTLLVDAEGLRQRTSRHEQPRLRALRDAGAQVYLCSGQGRNGRLHLKALCVDRRTVFTGSANLTDKSLENEELHLKLVGEPVLSVLAQLLRARSRGALWCGA